jgi:uncharacterized protein YndB with AHSA1/START domain
MKPGDRVRVTTFVKVPPKDAFEVFTQETDLWWRRGPRFRFGGELRGVLAFEPKPGGRLYERYEGAAEPFEVGKVLVWEPGARLVFEWRLRNFAPGERTEVDVRFESAPGGTSVTLEHRGWSALPKEHPVRHGLDGEAFTSMIGLWWGDLMTAFRVRVGSKA